MCLSLTQRNALLRAEFDRYLEESERLLEWVEEAGPWMFQEYKRRDEELLEIHECVVAYIYTIGWDWE